MPESSLVVMTIAAVGAILAGYTAWRYPILCLGILFLLATASRITLETVFGTMRLEQPAIATVAVVLIATNRVGELRRLPRPALAVAAAFGLYLGAQAVSSAFVAPDPISSLRLTLWLAISMTSGIIAFVLARPVAAQVGHVFVAGGAINAATGIAVAVLFLVLGPDFDVGVQEIWSVAPRVYGLARETNLLASLLAICAPFVIELLRVTPRWRWAFLTALVIGAMPLAATRGAYLGLAAGLAAYGAVLLTNGERPALLRLPSAICVSALAIGVLAAIVLLPNPLERYIADTRTPVSSPAPVSTPPFEPGPSSPPSSAPEESTAPPPTVVPATDTVSFRFDRIPLALDDLRRSPLIGLGIGSFGQIHEDASQRAPDHIAILVIASLHDAGLVGTAGLTAGFLLLLFGLLKRAGSPDTEAGESRTGMAAACAGSLAAMLVSYQATNALHFALNWIIIGAAVAVSVRGGARNADAPAAPAELEWASQQVSGSPDP